LNNFLQLAGAELQLGNFVIGQRRDDLSVYTALSNDGQRTETNIADAILAIHHRGNGERGIDTAENTAADMIDRQRNGIIRGTLGSDNGGAGGSDIFFDLRMAEAATVNIQSGGMGLGINRRARDGGQRPGHEGRVTVLSKDTGVNILHTD